MKKYFKLLSFLLLSLLIFSPNLLSNGFTEINVTTTNDEIDGDCSTLMLGDLGNDISLREAVCVANNHPGLDTIILPDGTYTLDIGGPGEDNNLEGDLDITDDLIIVGMGDVIVENGIGDPGTKGDGDRIFHIIELTHSLQTAFAPSPGVDFKIDNITVTNGDVGCTGLDCQTGAGAIDMESTGNLEIFNSHVDGNQTSCQGNCCGAALGGDNRLSVGGIKSLKGGDVIINNSTVNENTSMCTVVGDPVCFPGDGENDIDPTTDDVNNTFPNCNAGAAAIIMGDGTFTLENNSEISNNSATCEGTQCHADSVIAIQSGGFDLPAATDINDVNIIDSEIKNNLARCEGDNCNADEVFESDSEGTKTLDGATIEDNEASCEGFNCDSDEIFSVDGSSINLIMTDSSVSNNLAKCEGYECDTDEVFECDGPLDVDIDDSRVEGNRQECEGISCDVDETCSIDGFNGGTPTFTNFSVSFNVQECNGFECDTDEVFEIDGGNRTLEGVIMTGNRVECFGDYCDTDETFSNTGGNNMNTDLVVSNNIARCNGDFCDADEVVNIGGDDGPDTIENMRVLNNLIQCNGNDCVASAAVLVESDDAEVNINNSIISGNITIFDDTGLGGLGFGAGISNIREGTVNISNTIISNNETNGDGAGVYNGPAITAIEQDFPFFDPFCDHSDCTSNPDEVMPIIPFITETGGTINIEQSAIFGNIADANSNGSGEGGGIFESAFQQQTGGETNILNSTISGNSAYDGGGIYVEEFSAVNISNSTITDNSSMTSGGGIGLTNFAESNIKNSIVANQAEGDDCRIDNDATLNSLDHNLESGTSCGFTETNDQQNTDPVIGPLQFNGGPTPTHALLLGSPAIDAITDGSCTDVDSNLVDEDQRGFPRPFGSVMPELCDIGAYEFQSFINITKLTDPPGLLDEFDFTGTGFPGTCTELDGMFTLTDQQSASCPQPDTATMYSVSEDVPPGFSLDIECDVANNSGNTSVEINGDTVDIMFGEALDTVTCIFTNTSTVPIPPMFPGPGDPMIDIMPGDNNGSTSISFVNIDGGGQILVDLPDEVLPTLITLSPDVGTCTAVEFGTVANVLPSEADITCEINDFPDNLDLDIDLCKIANDTGIVQAEIEVIADSEPDTEFADFIDILLDALAICNSGEEPEDPQGPGDGQDGDGGNGCSITPANSATRGLPLILLIPGLILIRRLVQKKTAIM